MISPPQSGHVDPHSDTLHDGLVGGRRRTSRQASAAHWRQSLACWRQSEGWRGPKIGQKLKAAIWSNLQETDWTPVVEAWGALKTAFVTCLNDLWDGLTGPEWPGWAEALNLPAFPGWGSIFRPAGGRWEMPRLV